MIFPPAIRPKTLLKTGFVLLGLALFMTWVRAQEAAPEKNEWKDRLGLSDDQVNRLAQLQSEEKRQMKPLREQRVVLIAKLRNQIKNKADDAALKKTLDALADIRKAIKAGEEAFQESRFSILTPSQQAKMLLWHIRYHEMKEKKDREKEESDDISFLQ
jgi:Spy/CpxP family protein refolding chaperone